MDEKLDALGLRCPLPVLKARKRLQSMPAGACLILRTDDPAALVDVPHFCHEFGVTMESCEEESQSFVFKIRK